eukprot:13677-Eustigmatos_ZCMA.PRE.1
MKALGESHISANLSFWCMFSRHCAFRYVKRKVPRGPATEEARDQVHRWHFTARPSYAVALGALAPVMK